MVEMPRRLVKRCYAGAVKKYHLDLKVPFGYSRKDSGI